MGLYNYFEDYLKKAVDYPKKDYSLAKNIHGKYEFNIFCTVME